jgi:hypothetical protein
LISQILGCVFRQFNFQFLYGWFFAFELDVLTKKDKQHFFAAALVTSDNRPNVSEKVHPRVSVSRKKTKAESITWSNMQFMSRTKTKLMIDL